MAKNPYYNADRGQTENGGVPPLYDYDSNEFYDIIKNMASVGAEDKEIASALHLDDTHFSLMKNGKVGNWTDEQNEERGQRLREILRGARNDTNFKVRAVYLTTAMGKNSSKTTTTVRRRMRIDGQLTDNEEIQTTEVVSGIAPNLQALATWLYHHDEEWRKVSKGIEPNRVDPNQAPQEDEVVKGVNIADWLDQEMLDKKNDKNDTLQEKGEEL